MDTVMLFAITACVVCASLVYLFMEYRAHGERDKALSSVLGVQAEVAAKNKKLLTYSKYLDYLPAGKAAVADQAKSLVGKVVREYTHVEKLTKEQLKQDSDTSVIVRYSVEFIFGVDLQPANFEVLPTTAGIEIQIGRPVLKGTPVVKPLSQDISGVGVPLDERAAIKAVHDKLPGLAQWYAPTVAAEEATRALCRLKVIEFLHEFLRAQHGVTQLPGVYTIFK